MTLIAPCVDGRHPQCEKAIEYAIAGRRQLLVCSCECHAPAGEVTPVTSARGAS